MHYSSFFAHDLILALGQGICARQNPPNYRESRRKNASEDALRQLPAILYERDAGCDWLVGE
jgi:hypothetical protein